MFGMERCEVNSKFSGVKGVCLASLVVHCILTN